jgi:hypothetical protein
MGKNYLYPGCPIWKNNKFVLDDEAIADSLALYMETQLEEIYFKISNVKLPDAGREDRRLLFVAIARGILQYFEDKQKYFMNSITFTAGNIKNDVSEVDFNVSMKPK